MVKKMDKIVYCFTGGEIINNWHVLFELCTDSKTIKKISMFHIYSYKLMHITEDGVVRL